MGYFKGTRFCHNHGIMKLWISKGYYPFALNRQEEFCHLSDPAAFPHPNSPYSSAVLIAESRLIEHYILALPIGRNVSFNFWD